MSERIYLDHNASTPLCPEARSALLAAIDRSLGNPSAPHWAGREAAALMATARDQIAATFGWPAGSVVATSGGSEANNQAIAGLWHLRPAERTVVVVSAIEHPATAAPAAALAAAGAEVRVLPVTADGTIDLAHAARLIDERVALVSVMHVHNETGAMQPVAELARLAHAAGAAIHCDAAQSVGKIPVRPAELEVDLVSVAGHKFGAPKGVGALLVRPGLDLPPLIRGAGHEQGRRAGTENLLLFAALGAACSVIDARIRCMEHQVRPLRDRLEAGLCRHWGRRALVIAAGAPRLPNTSFLALRERDAGAIRAAVPDLAISAGSACHAGGAARPAILDAIGLDSSWNGGTLRFSLGPETTAEEIDRCLSLMPD